MQNVKMGIAATAGLLSLAGCATVPELSPDERALIADTWYLASIIDAQEEIRLRPQLGDRHTLSFRDDMSMSMQLDCNRGNADWSADPDSGGMGGLMIGRIAATRALCPPPTYGERLAAELPRALSYELGADGRTLTIRTEDTTFGFEAR